MESVFDVGYIITISQMNPLEIMWIFFIRIGWIILLITGSIAWWQLRLFRLQGKYMSSIEFILLAIDIPKDSEQTPKAMEQVFATISGAHSPINMRERYLQGVIQLSFSFEIVSIDGYIQFLVRTPKIYRDLIEGSIYSHYPDAEINEVYDYTSDFESKFPNDTYNLWGAEIELAQNEAYPIRTYQAFEDQLSQELKDPLASLLETMSRIQKGEQVWIQIIILPTDNSWIARSLNLAYKIAGKKVKSATKSAWYSWLLDFLYHLPDDWFPIFQSSEFDNKKQSDDKYDFRVMNLTPGERASVEAIEHKASKIGFVSKIRLLYLSPHELYQPGRVISSVFGAMKQFGDLSLNAFRPNKRTKTKINYFNVENRTNNRRQRIMNNYKYRSWYYGSKSFILNTEELATLYHFPSILVKTPFVKRTEVKKSDSPVSLPTFAGQEAATYEDEIRKQLAGLELDNDYYEQRYAKINTNFTPGAKDPEPATTKKPNDSHNQSAEQSSTIPSNLPLIQ